MPIPDTVAPNDDYREAQRRAEEAQNAETARIFSACNAFLRKQFNCKTLCMACKEGCEELKEWEALEEK